MRAIIYARYSSDMQRPQSIADQIRVCRDLADRLGAEVVDVLSDSATSGNQILRAGLQEVLASVRSGRTDLVLAEALDRISRDMEDVAALFKQITFRSAAIHTVSEGRITELHVGLNGTMNALFLKQLAEKTHRGLRGRVEAGHSGGGRCFGYRLGAATGEREIVETEAAHSPADLQGLRRRPQPPRHRHGAEPGRHSRTAR